MERILEKAYYDLDEPTSYGSVDRLAKSAGTSKEKTREWLESQDAYTLHRPVKRKFRRRRVYAKHVNDVIQADLLDLQSLAKFNDGYRFVLVLIDVFGTVHVLHYDDDDGVSDSVGSGRNSDVYVLRC